MSDILLVGFVVYGMVGVGAALGIQPRPIFAHPFERFVVRLSAGLVWPFYLGYLMARNMPKN